MSFRLGSGSRGYPPAPWVSRGSTSNSIERGVLLGMYALILCDACGTHLAIDQFRELPWECKCGELVAERVNVLQDDKDVFLLKV